jgi:5'-nucleotidase (lipoprotein e(P4) family)
MIRNSWMAGTLAVVLSTGAALAQTAPQTQTAPVPAPAPAPQAAVPQSDMLLATLWTQRSVEFKANALTAFTLARIRLDEGLADKNWTAAPAEQKGDFANLPPAVILDIDETLLDNSAFQVWMLKADQSFSTKTWNQFCAAQMSTPIPGAVEFAKYAESKGVKVFYITNRGVETEADTRKNMEKYDFPMGGNVDIFLMQNKQQGWGSAKGTRRAVIAKDYRIVLNVGDNFGDFDDAYRGNEAQRLAAFEANRVRWGREWIMIANPTYGSFDTATFGHDFKKSRDEQRKAKIDVLEGWSGPK